MRPTAGSGLIGHPKYLKHLAQFPLRHWRCIRWRPSSACRSGCSAWQRRAETIKRALEAELYFYDRIFGFAPADAITPVEIDNLPACS